MVKLKDYEIPCGDCGKPMTHTWTKKRWYCRDCERKEELNTIRSGNGRPDKYSTRR